MIYSSKQAHLLIHKNTQYVLETSEQEINQKYVVELAPIIEQNRRQFWLLQGQVGGNFEIVNGFTDQLLTYEEQKIIVQSRQGRQGQTWVLQFVSYHQFYIKLAKQQSKYLCLKNGNLVLSQCRTPLKPDIWLSRPILDNPVLNNSCFIISTEQKKAIDVPAGSRTQGSIVMLNQANYRFTQRWNIYKAGQIYVIKSLFTKMNLDIFQQKFQDQNDVVQWPSDGKVNQFWFLQKIYGAVYRISTFTDRQLQLGHRYGKLILHKGHNFTWIIEGLYVQ